MSAHYRASNAVWRVYAVRGHLRGCGRGARAAACRARSWRREITCEGGAKYKVNQNTHALTDQPLPTFATSAPTPPFATASAPVHPAPPVRATRSSKGFTFRATVKPAAAPPMLRQLLAST